METRRGVPSVERRSRLRVAANTMAHDSLIIANVPLAPAVYRELRSQAVSNGQTPAQLTAILSRAAGQ